MKKTALTILAVVLFSSPCFGQDIDLKKSYDLGIIAFNENHFEDAKIILERVTSLTNKYPVAFYVLGKIYRKPPYEDNAKARQMFEKAYLNAEANLTYKKYSLVMLSYTIKDNTDLALEKAKEAYELDSKDLDVQFAYAMALNRKGVELISTADKALPYIKESTKVRKDIYQSKNNLAFCYLELIDEGKIDKEKYCSEIENLLDYVSSKVKPYPAYNENLGRFKKLCH